MKPGKVTVTNNNGQAASDVRSLWDTSSNTLYPGFENSPHGMKVSIEWLPITFKFHSDEFQIYRYQQ